MTPRRGSPAVLAILLSLFSGCYDYKPVLAEKNPDPEITLASPQGSQPPKTLSEGDDSVRKREALESERLIKETQVCIEQYPDAPGRKADQVRCIVTKTDAILDRTHPETTDVRRSISAYAIQLAEREDRREITHDQAENLFMQFVQHTPGAGIPPDDAWP